MKISARARWTTVIVLMLLFPVTLYAFAFYLTSSDPSFMVAKDYEHRAEHYDDEMKLREASDRLGWSVEIDSESNVGSIALTIKDRDGRTVDDATVGADVFHAARAAQVDHVCGTAVGHGRYEFAYDAKRSGFHVLKIAATRGDEHFDTELRRYLEPGGRDGVPR